MMPIEQKGVITRRSFFQGTTKALAGAGALAAVNSITPASAGVRESSSSGPAFMQGKIALEEHFDFAATVKSSNASFGGWSFSARYKTWALDASRRWIEEAWKSASSRSSDLESRRFRIPVRLSTLHAARMTI